MFTRDFFARYADGLRWRVRAAKKLTLRGVYQRRLRELRDIGDPNGRRLARVLDNLQSGELPGGARLIEAIERERASMLASDEPLVDGTLGAGKTYDAGSSLRKACESSKGRREATFLYLLVREFRPLVALELGTNVGVSSAYQAAALRLNGGGTLKTLEASPYRLRLARRLHEKVGLAGEVTYGRGSFKDTLGQALRESGPIDYAFIDGHHDYQPTLDYFQTIRRGAKDGALIVFDDISWSRGMRRAWGEIKADRHVAVAADFGTMGVCVTARNPSASGKYVTRPIRLL